MRNRLLFLFFITSITFAKAQTAEFGMLLGGMSYRGELNQTMFNHDARVWHSSYGFLLRQNLNAHYALRVNLLSGRVSGEDAFQKYGYALQRNLAFTSPVRELSGLIEFNFLPIEKFGSPVKISPYVYTGLAFCYINPTLELNGATLELSKLQLEGKAYSKIQAALPMGVGVKARAGSWVFSIEAAPRKTTTDYLDDVSTVYLNSGAFPKYMQTTIGALTDTTLINIAGRQRGNSKDKDWYVFLGFTITHKLGNVLAQECKRLMRNQ